MGLVTVLTTVCDKCGANKVVSSDDDVEQRVKNNFPLFTNVDLRGMSVFGTTSFEFCELCYIELRELLESWIHNKEEVIDETNEDTPVDTGHATGTESPEGVCE